MDTRPLMPKATAIWLIDHTALTFDQIADFCGLHMLEVESLADGEVNPGMQGLNPIAAGHVTQKELDRCQNDAQARLTLNRPNIPMPVARSKGPRYTPVAKRGDKPDAIAYLLRTHPELADSQICKLIGTTKPTIQAVRDRTHWNTQNIKPQNPVLLGLCPQPDLDVALEKAAKRVKKTGEMVEEPEGMAEAPALEGGSLDEAAAAALRSFTEQRGG